jgi:predicted aspartyl protease
MRRLICIALAAIALAAAAPRGSAAGGLEEILKKHIAALGGEKAIRSINSVASTAEIELLGTGLKGTVKSQSLKSCLSYSEISLGFFKMKEGYDGEHIWLVDPNGKLQIKHDQASIEYQKTQCLIESQDYLFGGPGFAVTDAGRDTAGGALCDVLQLNVNGGVPCKLFLSDSTYLLEKLEIKAPEGMAFQTFGDYRPVAGVMFAFTSRTEMPSVGQKIEIRYQTITPNGRIDPELFVPPPGDVKDYIFAKGASAQGVPFVYRYRHLFIPVRLGTPPVEKLFLVDSGASMTVIDSALAAKLKLPLGGKVPGAGAGGTAEFYMVRVPGYTIDGITFSEQTAITYPIAGLLERFEEVEIGGILGYDFLSRFTTRIDYAGARFSFFEPDSFTATGKERVVEAPLMHNIFSLPISLDGTKGTFILDTGATSSVIQGSFAEKNNLASGRRTLGIALRGAGGQEGAELCRFDSLVVGGIALRSPVLAIGEGTKGLASFESFDGVIGNDILDRFTVTLDYKHQRVLLEPNGRFDEPFYRDRSGLQLMRTEKGDIAVAAALPGSPAEAAGFKPDDVVLSIAGKKALKYAGIDEIMKLFEDPEGTTYKIDISRDGKKLHLELTLREYI